MKKATEIGGGNIIIIMLHLIPLKIPKNQFYALYYSMV